MLFFSQAGQGSLDQGEVRGKEILEEAAKWGDSNRERAEASALVCEEVPETQQHHESTHGA